MSIVAWSLPNPVLSRACAGLFYDSTGAASPHAIRHLLGTNKIGTRVVGRRPPLWSSGQSFLLQIQGSRVRFPGTTKKISRSGTGSTQPREYN
jgi:hypothetical protein